jgi:hypothetical protein
MFELIVFVLFLIILLAVVVPLSVNLRAKSDVEYMDKLMFRPQVTIMQTLSPTEKPVKDELAHP